MSGKDAFGKSSTLKIKGIAIIFMLFHHCFNGKFMYERYSINFFPLTEGVVNNIAWFGKICVSIFAFLSAYGLTISYNNKKSVTNLKQWYMQRLIKLMSGYWFVFILAFVICQLIDGYSFPIFFKDGKIIGTAYILLDACGLSGLFLTPSLNGSWWYMSLAIVIILTVPVLSILIKKIGGFITIMLVVIMPRVFNSGFLGNNAVFTFMTVVAFGCCFAENKVFDSIKEWYDCTKSKVAKMTVFITLALISYILYRLYCILPIEMFYDINYAVTPVVVIIFCHLFIERLMGIDKILEFIGKHSMNIFFVHIFIRSVYAEPVIFSFNNCFLVIIVLLMLSIIVSFGIEMLKRIIQYDKAIMWLNEKCKKIDVVNLNI